MKTILLLTLVTLCSTAYAISSEQDEQLAHQIVFDAPSECRQIYSGTSKGVISIGFICDKDSKTEEINDIVISNGQVVENRHLISKR